MNTRDQDDLQKQSVKHDLDEYESSEIVSMERDRPAATNVKLIKASQSFVSSTVFQRALDNAAVFNMAVMRNPSILKTLQQASEVISRVQPQLNSAGISALRNSVAVSNSLMKPEYLELAQRTAQVLRTALPRFDELIKQVNDSYRSVVGNFRYMRILEESQWPLYLIDDESLVEGIKSLPDLQDEGLMEAVDKIAMEKLGEDWLADVHARWADCESLDEDEHLILCQALDHHDRGDYAAAVSILMCLIEGLICKYCGDSEQLEGEMLESFNWEAQNHNIAAIDEKGKRSTRKGREFNIRDRVIILLLNADKGWYTWRAACSYLIDVTLTSKDDPELAQRNPLRNKICHGVQTNYGSLMHSIKSILVVDMIIRLGQVVAACRAVEQGDGNDSDRVIAERESSDGM